MTERFIDEARQAIERARLSRKESDLDRAAKRLNSRAMDGLPEHVQTHLATLYCEAALACYGGMN